MVTRWLASAVLSGAVLLGGQAIAGEIVNSVTCPETARRNASINADVSFYNPGTQNVLVTKGALGLHLGNVTLVGPLAFAVKDPSTGLPPMTVNSGTSATLRVPVRIPPQARPGTFVSVGLGFFGRTSAEDPSVQREYGAQGCMVEIVP